MKNRKTENRSPDVPLLKCISSMGIQLIKCRETFFRCLSILQEAKLRSFVDDETQNFCRITVIKLRVTHCIANTRTCKNCCHAAKENLLGHCLKAKCSLFIPDT